MCETKITKTCLYFKKLNNKRIIFKLNNEKGPLNKKDEMFFLKLMGKNG